MASQGELLDPKNKRCSQDNHSLLPDLTNLRCRHHNSSWVSYPQHESNQLDRSWQLGLIMQDPLYYNWDQHTASKLPRATSPYFLYCDKGCSHWTCHKPHHWGIPCCIKTCHHTSRKTEGRLLRQRNQFPRCRQPAPGGLQHASMSNPDDEGPGFPDNRRLRLEVYPPTWTILRRPVGSSSQINEIPPATNSRCSACHLWRTWHLISWDRGLSQLLTLCVLPSDPHISYLSPGHFLIGEPLTQLPTINYSNIKLSRMPRWQTFQQQLQNYWKGWSTDYLHELQHHQHWHRSSPNIQPGDPMILREDNTAPLPLAYNGHHWCPPRRRRQTRVVTVKTPKGTFKRPMAKFAPLPHVKNEL